MSEIHDPYDDQLRSARYRAERDQARQECERLRARLRDSVPREAYERKRAAWLRHIRECETALHRRRVRINELSRACNTREDANFLLNEELCEFMQDMANVRTELCAALGIGLATSWADAISAIRKRTMPEGMEWLVKAWPRFEDGEPVRFSDDFKQCEYEGSVSIVTMYPDGGFALNLLDYPKGERVRRPAPKALDADGAEIRVGEIVYDIDTGSEFTVSSIDGETVYVRWGYDFEKRIGTSSAKDLTHRAPVLAADGRPLREGETVWSVDSGTRYTVEKITDGIIPIKCRSEMGSTVSLHPAQLTHERHDSWERLEEDAGKSPCEYFDQSDGCGGCPHYPSECQRDKACDLVRRCRALAERGE